MQKRIPLYDNVKFILMILVVIGHFTEEVVTKNLLFRSTFLFIYGFHMPLFFFISGQFFNTKRMTQKIVYYISLSFLLEILLSLCYLITKGKASFSLLSVSGVPWFLFALAAFTLITYLLRGQNKTFLLAAGIILACFTGYDTSVGNYLCLSRIIVFYPFFLAGTMVSADTILRLKGKRLLVIPAVLILAVWFYFCFFNLEPVNPLLHLFTGKNPFSDKVVAYGSLARLLCYAISALTSAALVILIPNCEIPVITKMGTRTLDVYFWHMPILQLACHFTPLTGLITMGRRGIILFFLISVALSIVLSLGGVISYPLNKFKEFCYRPSDGTNNPQ